MDGAIPAVSSSHSPTRSDCDHNVFCDQLQRICEIAAGFRKVEPRPRVGSFEDGIIKALGVRRRRTDALSARSRSSVPSSVAARSPVDSADGKSRDRAPVSADHVDGLRKDVADSNGAHPGRQSPQHISATSASLGDALHDPPPSHRRADPDQNLSAKRKGCLCGAHRHSNNAQADGQWATEARPLPIKLRAGTCDRRTGRVASLLVLIAMWMMLSYLACVLVCCARAS